VKESKFEAVSVCIPAYNAGKYLSYTIDSIVNQTFKNIEIIISDNASNDNTPDIVEAYMHQDSRIKYRRNNSNIGYVRNIASVVDASQNEIIAIFHADDIYDPTIIENEINILKKRSDISAVFTKYRRFNGMLSECGIDVIEPWENILPYDKDYGIFHGLLDDFIPAFLEIGNPFCCPSLMTKKSDYLVIGGFTDNYPSNEDLELWIKYLQNGKRLAILDKTLVNYRLSPDQGSVFWWNKLELPIFYKVVDAMIIPLTDLSMKSINVYNRRKSDSYLNLAYRLKVKDPRRKEFIQLSAKAYHYSIFREEGIRQKFPLLFDLFIELIYDFKTSLRNKLPNTYLLLKRIYHSLIKRKAK
jgi:glycosyltransferase involved in cell wall biosynthesis